MRNDTQTDIDLLFKEGLEDARVKAPRGAWKAVSARLAQAAPAAAAATPKRSWLLWGAPAFAFAAAALAAVFFIGNTEKTIINSGESIIAEVQAAPVAEAADPQPSDGAQDLSVAAEAGSSAGAGLTAESAVAPVRQSARAGFVPKEIQSPDQIAVLPVEKQQKADESEAGRASEAGEGGISRRAESEAEAGQQQGAGEDYFAKLEAEDAAAAAKSSKRKAAIKVGGTVGGNDAHFTGLAHPAYSSGGPYSGVTETSVSVYGIPVSAGISGRFHITDKLAVSAGINWSLLTRTFAGKYKTAKGLQPGVERIDADLRGRCRVVGADHAEAGTGQYQVEVMQVPEEHAAAGDVLHRHGQFPLGIAVNHLYSHVAEELLRDVLHLLPDLRLQTCEDMTFRLLGRRHSPLEVSLCYYYQYFHLCQPLFPWHPYSRPAS